MQRREFLKAAIIGTSSLSVPVLTFGDTVEKPVSDHMNQLYGASGDYISVPGPHDCLIEGDYMVTHFSCEATGETWTSGYNPLT